jgi:hypothetical protein
MLRVVHGYSPPPGAIIERTTPRIVTIASPVTRDPGTTRKVTSPDEPDNGTIVKSATVAGYRNDPSNGRIIKSATPAGYRNDPTNGRTGRSATVTQAARHNVPGGRLGVTAGDHQCHTGWVQDVEASCSLRSRLIVLGFKKRRFVTNGAPPAARPFLLAVSAGGGYSRIPPGGAECTAAPGPSRGVSDQGLDRQASPGLQPKFKVQERR